ncbi:hypothetical protein C8Q76DRAFT_305682 [Earliella scabrosa]|nr:hypothetical protein C8Q76DRAFT_305682 [Earliella scabrosa]
MGNRDESCIRIYARWRERINLSRPENIHLTVVHRYDVPVRPSTPIRVGMHVQIAALSPAIYRTLYTELGSPPVYDVYDPQIVGRIIGAKLDGDLVSFAIENERQEASGGVAIAVITVPHLPGETVTLAQYERTCGVLFEIAPRMPGSVRLQENALVWDSLGRASPTPPTVLKWPDPAMYRHTGIWWHRAPALRSS